MNISSLSVGLGKPNRKSFPGMHGRYHGAQEADEQIFAGCCGICWTVCAEEHGWVAAI
jgi:hypothetical protein